ncbi:MAG TPA: glycosyltransferase [Methylomirabilota bacterium]|nr:glycosyltransferase [Methylomirabilota bacterium]
MPRVLMISPHFPPDTSAAAHRVRLLAPHLKAHGWEPTVVTVDPRDYEGRLDPGLAELVPRDLRVVRCRAWSANTTRRLGFGDLGLRAFAGLRATCDTLLRREPFDALFVTIYPTYPALLGRILKARHQLPFILDYQDPWIGAWGRTVGGGEGGRPDLRSRLSRAVAGRLEPLALHAADAITAVSRATYEAVQARYPWARRVPCVEIPLGSEPADFDSLKGRFQPNPYFDPKDGQAHICYVGTLLPTGFETLRAVLSAAARLRDRRPALYRRLHLRFFGTSNQTAPGAPCRVLPVARELGVDDVVSEIAPRLDYLDGLTVQTQATAILMMGSSERHYTASKLYPGLLAERPILAVYHEASTVVEALRRVARPPTARLLTYGDIERAPARVEAIAEALAALVEHPVFDPADVSREAMRQYSAAFLAGRLAGLLDRAREPR